MQKERTTKYKNTQQEEKTQRNVFSICGMYLYLVMCSFLQHILTTISDCAVSARVLPLLSVVIINRSLKKRQQNVLLVQVSATTYVPEKHFSWPCQLWLSLRTRGDHKNFEWLVPIKHVTLIWKKIAISQLSQFSVHHNHNSSLNLTK